MLTSSELTQIIFNGESLAADALPFEWHDEKQSIDCVG